MGESFGKTPKEKVKELCNNISKKIFEKKERSIKSEMLYNEITKSDSFVGIKKIRHIPATTVSIRNDSYDILQYIQRVGVNTKVFEKDEVIQFNLIPLDGKVYPFSPMEALLSEIYLLWLITQTHVSFFENGGHPDKVFMLPKEIAGSKNHQYLIETLQKYKKIQNKHGSLVFTGELKIEDLQKIENQMEHRELGLYVVGVLAMMYGIPSGRIPFLIGKAANNGDAGGLADSGYWRKISVWQSKIEELYNKHIFNPYFKLNMYFKRQYKQDEVREVQIEMTKTQVAEQRMRMGIWTRYEVGKYLDVPPEVIDQAKIEQEEYQKSQMLLQNSAPNNNVLPEPDKQLKNSVKKNTQDEKKELRKKSYKIKTISDDEIKVTEDES
jgi:hypothetical protein